MTSIPTNSWQTAAAGIDTLVENFGLRRVVLAMIARLFRKTRPPDSPSFPGLGEQADLSQLSDRLRRDVGLPPDQGRMTYVDPLLMGRRF